MSILFPKINKPRGWDYRPIYYDEEKYEREKRLESMKRKAQEEVESERNSTDEVRHTSLHRGSFREARENNSIRVEEGKKANKRFIVILAILLVIAAIYFVL